MTRHSFDIAVVAATLPSGWCATVDLPIHFRNSYVGWHPVLMCSVLPSTINPFRHPSKWILGPLPKHISFISTPVHPPHGLLTRTAQQPVRTKAGRTSMNNLDSLRATRLTRPGMTGKVTTFPTLRLVRPWGLTEALITSGERRPAQE